MSIVDSSNLGIRTYYSIVLILFPRWEANYLGHELPGEKNARHKIGGYFMSVADSSNIASINICFVRIFL